MTPNEVNDIIDTINCLDGEQYDINSKRCLPCTHYNLEWDNESKMCKIRIKNPIIISDNTIVGYL